MLTTARTRFLAVSAGLLVFASPQSHATNYSVIDLGTVTPAGVNNHGQVAVQQGLWSGGVMVPMAPFIAPVEPSGGDALDINDAGQILGRASYQIAGPCQSTNGGFRLSVVTDGALACAPGYVSQFPGRMNSAGKVAYYTWVVDPFGFVWDSQTGTNTQLAAGPPGPNSSIYQVATDINDLGDVVGSSNPPSAIGGLSRAVRWQGPVVTDLGIVGQAVAVGNGGQVAVNGGYLWDGGVLTNMGAFTPRDLNSSVNVVGSQQVAGAPHAVAWQGGVLADLNDLIPPASGWVLQSAARISDNGYIVGTGTLGGQSHGFLLVPDTITPTQADLTVSTSISPPGNYVSGPVTVTFTVTNNGPAPATRAALITNYRPFQFTYSPTITPSQGSCLTNAWNDHYVSDPTAYVWCALGSLAPGASATVQLTANSVTQNTTLGASTHAIEIDGNTADNAASQNVTKAGADLSVVMSDSPDPVQAGQPLTYTALVSNAGPDAGSAILNSSTPSSMTFLSALPSQGSCTGTGVVSCTLGNIPVGNSATVQFVVTPTTVGSFTRSASVSSTGGPADPVPGNNNASTTTTVSGIADLGLSMTAASTVIQGQTILYTINATNNGAVAVSNVIATGTLPTCSFGTIAAGATSVNCTRTVTASAPGTVTQTMTVGSPATDPNSGNDSATVSTTVLANAADVTLAISDSPDPVIVGGTVTYTITATNNGPLGANNVTVTGSLPACNFGGLAAGSSASCTQTAIASSAGSLTQNMTVSASSPPDPNSANNSASASTTVQAGADLAVTMTDSPDPVKKDRRLTYTIVVSNAGPLGATGVGLSVVLPANITFESRTTSQGSCTGKATVTCALGSLGSGSSATVTIKFKPKSIGTATSTASVTGSPADPNGANNVATASTTVIK